MGFIDWYKRTTFQGTIKRDLGSVTFHSGLGKGRLELRELEAKGVDRRFRLSLVRTGFLTWQEVPMVLTAEQMKRLGDLIQTALAPETETGSEPIRPGW